GWAEKPAQSNRQDACSTTYQFIVGWAEKPAQSNRQDACSTTYQFIVGWAEKPAPKRIISRPFTP
ncbi:MULTISPECIES: hypothetical protein, partial [unclassified Microcoleus]|uniref:hypothetical protein n=1 Tax=unclassified Microcoleus TaxID=2642155 RepID=UPI002FD0DFBA